MDNILYILLVPLVSAFLARYYYKKQSYTETAIVVVIACAITTGGFYAGKFGQTYDTEILNGQVTSKNRIHDTYEEAIETCTGSGESRSCTTTYVTHYTVDWIVYSNVGNVTIDSLDSEWSSVYSEPDPIAYANAYKGEPFAAEHGYTNYIKAVPESLFNNENSANAEFAKMIPSYPYVNNYYKAQHVLSVGASVPDIQQYNFLLAEHLKTIGPTKQANIIVIFVNSSDQSYRHALENAWLGGKKNDVIVLVGTPNFPEISWVDTITLGANAGNELMTVVMRDNITALGKVDKNVINTAATTVSAHYDRKPMQDYEYLADSIEVPTWIIVLSILLGIGAVFGAGQYFVRNPLGRTSRSYTSNPYRRRRF